MSEEISEDESAINNKESYAKVSQEASKGICGGVCNDVNDIEGVIQ